MRTRKKNNFVDIERVFEHPKLIEQALGEAVTDALRMHKRAGNPVVEWRDGKVVWIPPSKIRVPRTNGASRRAKSARRSRNA